MGNCANKPLTTEGEVPEVSEDQKTPKVEEISSREIQVDQNKDEEKKPEAEAAAKAANEVKPSQSAKFEDVVVMAVESKTEEAPKPTTEPSKLPAAEPSKPAVEPPKPAVEPPKPATEPPKPVAEPPKPAVEPKKEEVKPAVVAPATAPAVVEVKKPVTK